MSSDDSEKIVSLTIDRISGSGNGIAELDDVNINIGPVVEDAVGTDVRVKLQDTESGPIFAKCLEKGLRRDGYAKWLYNKFGKQEFTPQNTPTDITGTVARISGSGNPVIRDSRFPREILVYTDANLDPDEQVRVRIRESSFKHKGNFRADFVERVEGDEKTEEEREFDQRANKSPSTEIDTSEIHEVLTSDVDENDSPEVRFQQKNTSPETTDTELGDDTHLRELRKQAELAASENPTRADVEGTKSQYVRSEAIKRYAKRRADGECEWCGSSAPFVTNDGEPYLEVHHVHELGDGGEDSPESVIALCPTCHRRVHYGEDGEDLNENLSKKVETELQHIGTGEAT